MGDHIKGKVIYIIYKMEKRLLHIFFVIHLEKQNQSDWDKPKTEKDIEHLPICWK